MSARVPASSSAPGRSMGQARRALDSRKNGKLLLPSPAPPASGQPPQRRTYRGTMPPPRPRAAGQPALDEAAPVAPLSQQVFDRFIRGVQALEAGEVHRRPGDPLDDPVRGHSPGLPAQRGFTQPLAR